MHKVSCATKSTNPSEMSELWDDVSISIQNITPIINATPCNKVTLNNGFSLDYLTLRQFQRAHLWGIGL